MYTSTVTTCVYASGNRILARCAYVSTKIEFTQELQANTDEHALTIYISTNVYIFFYAPQESLGWPITAHWFTQGLFELSTWHGIVVDVQDILERSCLRSLRPASNQRTKSPADKQERRGYGGNRQHSENIGRTTQKAHCGSPKV